MDLKKELLRLADFIDSLPFSRAHWFRLVKAGRAPQPIKLSERVTVYRASDIAEFLNNPPRQLASTVGVMLLHHEQLPSLEAAISS